MLSLRERTVFWLNELVLYLFKKIPEHTSRLYKNKIDQGTLTELNGKITMKGQWNMMTEHHLLREERMLYALVKALKCSQISLLYVLLNWIKLMPKEENQGNMFSAFHPTLNLKFSKLTQICFQLLLCTGIIVFILKVHQVIIDTINSHYKLHTV